MSITDELANFTTSMNIQGKYEDPHARTDFQKEMDKLDESYKQGTIPLEDYQQKKAGLMRTLANRAKK